MSGPYSHLAVAFANTCGDLRDRYARLCEEANRLQREIDRLRGVFIGGCVSEVDVDGHKMIVEYEWHAREEPNNNVESPTCGPGSEPAAFVTQAYINGEWIDAAVFSKTTIDNMQKQIVESREGP